MQFSFPTPFKPEFGEKAKALHQAVEGQGWIEEVFAASGGIGGGPSSVWVFKLDNYASLDRLFVRKDQVTMAYLDFFRDMDEVKDFIREEFKFIG